MALVPLKATPVTPVKLDPRTVTEVPTGPLIGENEVILGTAASAGIAVPIATIAESAATTAARAEARRSMWPSPSLLRARLRSLITERTGYGRNEPAKAIVPTGRYLRHVLPEEPLAIRVEALGVHAVAPSHTRPPLDGITPPYLRHQFRASTATTTRELSWAYSAGLTLALLHVTLIVPPLGREAAPISE